MPEFKSSISESFFKRNGIKCICIFLFILVSCHNETYESDYQKNSKYIFENIVSLDVKKLNGKVRPEIYKIVPNNIIYKTMLSYLTIDSSVIKRVNSFIPGKWTANYELCGTNMDFNDSILYAQDDTLEPFINISNYKNFLKPGFTFSPIYFNAENSKGILYCNVRMSIKRHLSSLMVFRKNKDKWILEKEIPF